jgi:hypothetical protein
MAEGGLGSFQYHGSPNWKCTHDRLAKTIMVDEGKKAWPPETAAEQPDEPGSLNVVEAS